MRYRVALLSVVVAGLLAAQPAPQPQQYTYVRPWTMVPREQTDLPLLERFVAEHKITFPVMVDTALPGKLSWGQTFEAYGVYGIPKRGRISADGRLIELDKAIITADTQQFWRETDAEKPIVKNIGPDEAEELLEAREEVIVLDVRTPREYRGGRIAGAKNVDFRSRDFKEQLQKLDRDRPYLVHCAVGGRSAQTREMMQSLGFKQIYHLEGGIKAWEEAGKPLDK